MIRVFLIYEVDVIGSYADIQELRTKLPAGNSAKKCAVRGEDIGCSSANGTWGSDVVNIMYRNIT